MSIVGFSELVETLREVMLLLDELRRDEHADQTEILKKIASSIHPYADQTIYMLRIGPYYRNYAYEFWHPEHGEYRERGALLYEDWDGVHGHRREIWLLRSGSFLFFELESFAKIIELERVEEGIRVSRPYHQGYAREIEVDAPEITENISKLADGIRDFFIPCALGNIQEVGEDQLESLLWILKDLSKEPIIYDEPLCLSDDAHDYPMMHMSVGSNNPELSVTQKALMKFLAHKFGILPKLGTDGIEVLVKLLQFEGHPDISPSYYPVDVFAKLGRSALEPLIHALRHKEPRIRVGAAKALGRIGDRAVLEYVIQALGNWHERVQEAAIEMLGDIGDPSVVEYLKERFERGSLKLHKSAAEALRKICEPRTI